jgi:hypothetical protein
MAQIIRSEMDAEGVAERIAKNLPYFEDLYAYNPEVVTAQIATIIRQGRTDD